VTSATAATGNQIAVNGVVDSVTSNVTLLLYYNHMVYQENSGLGWWSKASSTASWTSTTDPRVTTPVTTGGPVAPTAAVNAGYTTLVMDDEFTSNTLSSASWNGSTFGAASAAANWYTNSSSSPPLTIGAYNVTPAGGTPASGTSVYINTSHQLVMTQTTSDNVNSCLGTSRFNPGQNGQASSQSTPGSNKPNVGAGRIFQYGYFEASIAIQSSGKSNNGGWPSWWSTGVFDSSGNNPSHCEIDFMENGDGANSFSSTVHEWDGGSSANGCPTNGFTGVSTFPSGFNKANFNTYGCLWTPTTIQFFINNTTTIMSAADNPISLTNGSLNKHSLNSSKQQVGGQTFPDCIAPSPFNGLVLACGSGNIMTVDWVRVWQ
jgi:hypothetical protein